MGFKGDITKIRPSRQRHRDLTKPELEKIQEVMANLFKIYGLKLKKVTKEALSPVATHPDAKVGFLQKELRYPINILHGLGAAAVCASGLGLGKNDVNKRKVDRSAAGVQGVGLHEILGFYGNRLAIVAASEGERVKPGEKGGNPARFRGQIFGASDLRKNYEKILDKDYEKDVQFINIVTDDVDGTGKATENKHSSVTSSVYTQSKVKPLPDEYMIKIVSRQPLPEYITTHSTEEEIVKAFSKAHGVPKSRLNLFALTRKRHDKPIEKILNLGPNFIMDTDGDVMPAIAAALGDYYFQNGYPLHGIAGNIGGAAEAGLLVPVIWRGGSVLLEFASKKGLKSNNWDDRYNYDLKEIQSIKKFGFQLNTPFKLEDLYKDLLADGIAVFGAITDNLHIEAFAPANKGLPGVHFGNDGVIVHSLEISSNGRAEILHSQFQYEKSMDDTKDKLTPYLTKLLDCNLNEVEKQFIKFNKENRLRLKTEFMQEYYLTFSLKNDCMMFDEETYKSLRKEGDLQRFSEIDDKIINTAKEVNPHWFC